MSMDPRSPRVVESPAARPDRLGSMKARRRKSHFAAAVEPVGRCSL